MRQQINVLQSDNEVLQQEALSGLEYCRELEKRLKEQVKAEQKKSEAFQKTMAQANQIIYLQKTALEKLEAKLDGGENTLVVGNEEVVIAPIPQPIEESESVAVKEPEQPVAVQPVAVDDAVTTPDDSAKVDAEGSSATTGDEMVTVKPEVVNAIAPIPKPSEPEVEPEAVAVEATEEPEVEQEGIEEVEEVQLVVEVLPEVVEAVTAGEEEAQQPEVVQAVHVDDALTNSADSAKVNAGESTSTKSEQNEDNLRAVEEIATEPKPAVDRPASLNQAQLTKRLGYAASSSVNRNKIKADFTEWSRKTDPDGIGWRWDGATLFHPVIDSANS